jgi:hypothetical protein
LSVLIAEYDIQFDAPKIRRVVGSIKCGGYREGQFGSSLVFAFLLTSAQSITSQEDLTSSIVGVWKITSFARKEVGTGKISKRYGERPMGYTVFTPNGLFIAFAVAEGRKTPAKPDPSDTERPVRH